MPEIPPSHRRQFSSSPAAPAAAVDLAYAELHCKTNFSFLEGASHPDELVARAVALGYRALAITDRNTLAGVVRAHAAARQCGLPLVIGAEITPDDAPPVVLWTTDRASYGRLSRLITLGRRRAAKGAFQVSLCDVAEHAEGLLAGVVSPPGELADLDSLRRYRQCFPGRCHLLAELFLDGDDDRRLDRLALRAREAQLPLLATGDVHYHTADRAALADVLAAIRSGETVDQARGRLFPNAERHLQSLQALAARFSRYPTALAHTAAIAQCSTFSLDQLRYEYPEELAPPGETPLAYLTRLAWSGARRRYPAGVPPRIVGLIEHELTLIAQLRYEAYFLTVYDLVRFARERGILCQGRGSAANSVVCYCLEITSVDPDRLETLFERFISRERNEAPDIDVDFEHERREEVLQYLYEKYGRERAGMTAEVITYRPRMATRDVGKALGLSADRIDRLAKDLDSHRLDDHFENCCRAVGIDPASPLGSRLVWLVRRLVGFPRHLGQHVGGMVITRGPLDELVPIENASMPGRTVIEWDKDDLDELGILKVDCLSLGMLTALSKCFDLVARHDGRVLGLSTLPQADEQVYDMICRADTIGVFQIESRAQMAMLPRLRPREYYDLVIEVAIVRPGPIQGKMVHPYLRRRSGDEPITYPNDAIRAVLERTLGVPLFQEQAMRLAVVAAGFTPGQADQLRRAMGAWRRPGVIDEFRRKLIEGMRARGLDEEFANNLFEQIRGFGEYGFPESHAASFALLVYASAWLKHHYPAAFAASLLNSQPMGFYAPAQLVRSASEHGVEVRPIDVAASRWDCTLEERASLPENGTGSEQSVGNPDKAGHREVPVPIFSQAPVSPPVSVGRWALRLGLRLISGLSADHAQTIERVRQQGKFRSLDDFSRRTRLGPAVLRRLAAADALASLGHDRRGTLWEVLGQGDVRENLPLFADAPLIDAPVLGVPAADVSVIDLPDEPIGSFPLPPLGLHEEVVADYQTIGLSLRAHPLRFEREKLARLGVVPAARLATLADRSSVRVAGLVLVRQRPATASGITFVTLEDETGTANLIVRPDVWRRFFEAACRATILVAHGRLQRQGEIVHVLVARLEDFSPTGGDIASQSRDFR
ncbi:MAG TPA: error-prone DNA polymerase [Pirellulales bacterium]|jgi:error-prone DNA polymerase|nr:error-prone DNA polymerase [Pirellulales bacterium]